MVADPDDLALARLIDTGTIGKILVVFLAVTLKSLGFSLFLYIDGRRLDRDRVVLAGYDL